MTDPHATAERILRRFARETNLLISGRPVRVSAEAEDTAVALAVAGMARALGARLVEDEATSADVLDIDVRGDDAALSLGGAPLASRGDAGGRLDFAAAHMPVSTALAEEIGAAGTVRGLRVGVAMTLEPKTANLALLLQAAGAEVAVYAHPDETDPAVAAALRARGVPVDADATLSGEAERAAALAWLRRGFDVVVDDGSHLVRLAHEAAPELVESWIGVTEETTSGLTPLRAMATQGALRTPVVAVNDAATKTGFDNRYGTGQSCVLAIADLIEHVDATVRDLPVLVIGYGPVGVGVAAHLRALGAEVAVAEIDPVRALLAAHDGYPVGRAEDHAPGALVISCTGAPGTVTRELLELASIVAVAGGVPGEVDLDLAALEPVEVAGRTVDHLDVDVERGTLVLDRGGCINVTAAEGNPIEIMDLSFATQLAAIRELVETRPGPGVHAVSDAAVAHVAATAARVRGVALDARPASSAAASSDWHSPRYREDRA
ncbi:adenosylhomocysteinase [Demequina sp. SYSU T00039]|uniref:Adenosylhomocysteinase n=1 Tax=Demequina lignilytica TaxID=3051663 RepID=A0AAW7M5B2_9MICO|nr:MULTISPECIES: adenosylhomocysteinase [unclassified Demequina]MDN4477592.1 adenosylhomocysteinase [Demequina sp. SYSU T00039-1]MDN4488057.1 adenosylhomocysteinase [Demequina sp. SYSU T00039]MDN4490497.1 adenosylhomocysteinase [Demequina sp. SYSU T00068]